MASCQQRQWVEHQPVGTIFRSGEMPGRSRAAVHTFLSREAGKDSREALCVRIGADLYWIPEREPRYGYPTRWPFKDTMRKVVGRGFGVAGHTAGLTTRWLTHSSEQNIGVAAVDAPSGTRPIPGYVIRRRSNQARRRLNPTEVAYLEAVRSFDECAEVSWDEALRITAETIASGHLRELVRPEVLLEAAFGERCRDAARIRERVADVCGAINGEQVPPDRDTEPYDWPGRPAVLEAAHLPWLIDAAGHGPGRGRAVPVSQFVKDWAHWPDRREGMCVREPSGPNRLELVRVAATVHALCRRDAVPIPAWVWRHRWRHDIRFYSTGPVDEPVRLNAVPAVCEYHRVWFGEDHIMDHRVHGLWEGQVP